MLCPRHQIGDGVGEVVHRIEGRMTDVYEFVFPHQYLSLRPVPHRAYSMLFRSQNLYVLDVVKTLGIAPHPLDSVCLLFVCRIVDGMLDLKVVVRCVHHRFVVRIVERHRVRASFIVDGLFLLHTVRLTFIVFFILISSTIFGHVVNPRFISIYEKLILRCVCLLSFQRNIDGKNMAYSSKKPHHDGERDEEFRFTVF